MNLPKFVLLCGSFRSLGSDGSFIIDFNQREHASCHLNFIRVLL
jgi:hypothetical protein